MIYPKPVNDTLGALSHAGSCEGAVGSEVNFDCGSVVKICLDIEPHGGEVRDCFFRSNGCGWMMAAAEMVCEYLQGKDLGSLHGLPALEEMHLSDLGQVPAGRAPCLDAVFAAVKAAVAEHRLRRLDEYRGERPLVCTCFGVTEDRLEALLRAEAIGSVEEVGERTNAGTGCGSCRMLIQEILDSNDLTNFV